MEGPAAETPQPPTPMAGEASLEPMEWALVVMFGLPLLSLIEYLITSLLISQGVCTPCTCNCLASWNLHSKADVEEDSKPADQPAREVKDSLASPLEGVNFVDAEAGDGAAAAGAQKADLQGTEIYKRKHRLSITGQIMNKVNPLARRKSQQKENAPAL